MKYSNYSLLISLSFAGTAFADPIQYAGTPLMESHLQILSDSFACDDFRYVGASDRESVQRMRAKNQQTTLLAEPMKEIGCTPDSYQLEIGSLRYGVVANSGESSARCEPRLREDIPGYRSSVPDWAKVLQLVYGGTQGLGGDACADDERRELIENWDSLWSSSCTQGDCERLRFAFYPNDETLGFFKKLIGVNEFCNGPGAEDNDPIRTDCSNAQDVDWCPNKDLGVVQPIAVDTELASEPWLPCEFGRFDFSFVPDVNDTGDDCPDNTARFAGFLCLYPRDCRGGRRCVNTLANNSPFAPFEDGRVFNQYRFSDSDATYVNYKDLNMSASSMHFNQRCQVEGARGSAAKKIACLVHEVACSMGVGSGKSLTAPEIGLTETFACGRSVSNWTFPAQVDRKIIDSEQYPWTQPLYLVSDSIQPSWNAHSRKAPNSSSGCENVDDPQEQSLCRCLLETKWRANVWDQSELFQPAEYYSSQPCSLDQFSKRCGDGIVGDDEACDDGNTQDGDYCSADCSEVRSVCGDGVIQGNEKCDDGNTQDGDYCDAKCLRSFGRCGDGIKQPFEGCDDGNVRGGDGCSSDCRVESPLRPICGNRIVELGEECDGGSGCRSNCTWKPVIIEGPGFDCGSCTRRGLVCCETIPGTPIGFCAPVCT